MSEEDKPEVEEPQQASSDEPVEAEVMPEGEAPPAPGREPPQWEYRTRFRINDEMVKVVGLTIKVTESELAVLRRKLNKLTYGS